MKINTKTKKSDLVAEVLNRGLKIDGVVITEEVANSKTRAELLLLLKDDTITTDSKNDVDVVKTETTNSEEEVKIKTKKKLPKKNKVKENDGNVVKFPSVNGVIPIEKDGIKGIAFEATDDEDAQNKLKEMLGSDADNVVLVKTDVVADENSSDDKIVKDVNDAFEKATEELKKGTSKKKPKHEKQKRKTYQEQLSEISEQLSEESNQQQTDAEVVKVVNDDDIMKSICPENNFVDKNNVDMDFDTSNMTEDEKIEFESQLEILSTIVALKDENESLKITLSKKEKRIKYLVDAMSKCYNKMVIYINKLANSCNEANLESYKFLRDASYFISDSIRTEYSIIDMEELIKAKKEEQERIAMEKAEAEKRKQQELQEERSFLDGEYICYKDGKPYKPKGCKAKDYNVYLEWYDFIKDWISYASEKLLAIRKETATTKKNKMMVELKKEMKNDFVGTFADEEFSDDVIDMISETLDDFYKYHDEQIAIAYLLACIDGEA